MNALARSRSTMCMCRVNAIFVCADHTASSIADASMKCEIEKWIECRLAFATTTHTHILAHASR